MKDSIKTIICVIGESILFMNPLNVTNFNMPNND